MNTSQSLLHKISSHIKDGKIVVEYDVDEFFEQIEANFTIYGSKIDWSNVVGSIVELARKGSYSGDCVSFFNKIAKGYLACADTKVVLLGDSAMDYALITSLNVVFDVLEKMLELPQHHYIAAYDFSWCISFSMEGDMAFGVSQAKSKTIVKQ